MAFRREIERATVAVHEAEVFVVFGVHTSAELHRLTEGAVGQHLGFVNILAVRGILAIRTEVDRCSVARIMNDSGSGALQVLFALQSIGHCQDFSTDGFQVEITEEV